VAGAGGESSLTAYQFWVVAGGVAALHFEQFHAWLSRHRALVGFALLGICLRHPVFFGDVARGRPARVRRPLAAADHRPAVDRRRSPPSTWSRYGWQPALGGRPGGHRPPTCRSVST